MSWLPPPEPVEWPLPKSLHGSGFSKVSLRAPTGEDIIKSTALPGSNPDITHRLIEAVSGVPYDVLKKLPWWQLKQMSDYLDEFAGAPVPGPLEAWHRACAVALAKSPAATEAPPAC